MNKIYINKIKNQIIFLDKFVSKKIENKKLKIFKLILSGYKPVLVAKKYNLDVKKIRQIKTEVDRKLKHFSIRKKLELVANLIERSFTFENRFLYWKNDHYFNLLKAYLHKKFKFINYFIIDIDFFNYLKNSLKNSLVSKKPLMEHIINDKEFEDVRHKILEYKNYFVYGKDNFLKLYFFYNEILDIKKEQDLLIKNKISISVRGIDAILERKDFLIKMDSWKFKLFTKEDEKNYLATLPIIKECVYQKGIYKYEEILNFVNKQNQENFIFYENDLLYYLTKKLSPNDFHFQKGNMLVIYPKDFKILELNQILKDKFPQGYGLVDFNWLKKLGYSKTINLNCDTLWNKVYISKENQNQLKMEFEKYFNKGLVINRFDEIKKESSEVVKFYFDNFDNFSRISNMFEDIILVSNTFINHKIPLNENSRKELIKFLANASIKQDLKKLLISLKTNNNDNNRINKIRKILIEKSILKDFFRFLYENYKLYPENKNLVREIFQNLKKTNKI